MALDFSQWCGFNFRATLANATDGTNEFGIYNSATQTYAALGDYGFTGTVASAADDTTNTDRRVRGRQTISTTGTTFAIKAPNAGYDMRLAYGALNVANTRTGVIVVDTVDVAFRGTGISGILSTSGSASLNLYYVNNAQTRVYKCITNGTYTSGNPSGTSQDITDGGTAHFAYVGEVVHIFDTGATPTIAGHAVVDVDNTVNVAGSAWPTAGTGGTQPRQKSITVANGGLTFLKHPNASFFACHIGLKMQTTPLQAVDLRDHTGGSLGSNPQIHAGQPTGKLIAQLYFPAGSAANIALGGTLAGYFQVVTVGAETWLASRLPMPDGTTGNLQIIQTDASAAITGSPFTTTFSTASSTLTVVSSQSKPTRTSGVSGNALAYALISTQCWLNHNLVRTTVEATWNGWTNQTFTNDIAVSSDAQLATAITTVNAAVGSGVWQRIRITGGTFTDRTWTTANYSQGGTGGLIVQGAGTHTISGYWIDSGGWRGVHFDNLTFSPGVSSSFGNCLKGINRAAMDHEVVVTNCTFGTDGNTGVYPIQFYTGKSVRIRNNTFLGYSNAIDVYGVRCVEVGGNTYQHFAADMLGCSVFDSITPVGKGVLADDHQYIWYYDCRAFRQYDIWSGFTTDNNPHCDALQVRHTVIGWVTGTNYGAGTWVLNTTVGRIYKTTAGGVAGATIPSHAAGDASDGGVTWTYVGEIASGPRLFLSVHGNRFHGTGATYADLDGSATSTGNGVLVEGVIGFIQESSAGLPSNASVFNNILASTGVLSGWVRFGDDTQPHYVEYNTFGGPAFVPDVASPAPVSNQRVLQDAAIKGGGVFARKNIAGDVESISFDEDNLVISWGDAAPDPGLQLRGPTTRNAVNDIWGFSSLNEDASAAAFASQLESILAPLPANAGYGATSQSLPGGRRSGALGLGLGLGL